MPYTDINMLMHGQTDFLELLLGKNQEELLTADGQINPFIPERDQQLDMDSIVDPSDESTLIDFGYNFVANDSQCPQVAMEEIVELPQEDLANLPQLENEQPLVFQFPSFSETGFDPSSTNFCSGELSGNITVEIVDGDLTDTESTYSIQVPSTPFSPTSPFSLPPQTPDTASSMDSTSGNVPAFIKSSLKMAIKSKRQREGKGDIQVEFLPPPPEQLTEEEEYRRCEKREKNKMAAQKCREKKRQRIDELEDETRKLKKRQSAYKVEVQKLIDERDRLMDIINIHGQVCPSFRCAKSMAI